MWCSAILGITLTCMVCSGNCAKWNSDRGYFKIRYGLNSLMECEIHGDFDGFYDQTETKIVTGTRYRISDSDTSANTKVLEISKVTEEDYGIYTCNDSVSDDTATLEIESILNKLKPQYYLPIGYEGKINAEVFGLPRLPISWKKDGVILAAMDPSGNLTANKHNQYKIEYRGSLVIKNVKSSDSGAYEITIKFQASTDVQKTNVSVGYKPDYDIKPESSYTITKGLTLNIPCSFKNFDGIPTWKFNDTNGVVKTIVENVTAKGYKIQNIDSSYEGNYTCFATNNYGELTLVTSIALVITPAEITSEFEDMKVGINREFVVMCTAGGKPTPSVKLFHKGNEVANGEGSTNLTAIMSESYTGNYKCVTENGALDSSGESLVAEKSMVIIMLTPPVINKDTRLNPVTTALNYHYSFTCSASGNPPPTIEINQNGTVLDIDTTTAGFVVNATYKVANVSEDDLGDLICNATNTQGEDSVTVSIKLVVKAEPPTNIKRSGIAGLTHLNLKWSAVPTADSYVVFINESREEYTSVKNINIRGLQQNTPYVFQVACQNIAGVGNASSPVLIKTSDILRPGQVRNIKVVAITWKSAEIHWDIPFNVEQEDQEAGGFDIIYELRYCQMKNETELTCKERPSMRETSVTLDDLDSSVDYKVTIFGTNQRVDGESASYEFRTAKHEPRVTTPEPPQPVGKDKGMSTGVIAAIIIVIIIIILLVVDLFCCFFNHCGFTHCCFETFCSSSQNKYAPTDAKEPDEKQELKLKEEEHENIV